MIPENVQDLIILIIFFLLSLGTVYVLFRFLKAEAETKPLKLKGSLPGFILVFALYLSYWSLFQKGYPVAGILIAFNFLALFGSWILFKKLQSKAHVVVDKWPLRSLLGEHPVRKLRIGGGIAGYAILYLLLYGTYYYVVDNRERIQYQWHQKAIGRATIIETYYRGVSNGSNCAGAYAQLTRRFIEERIGKGQKWSNASEFCKYFATNRGHTNISYKRLPTGTGQIKFLMTVDFADAYIKNKFREELFESTLAELKGTREPGGSAERGGVLEIFRRTFYSQIDRMMPSGQKNRLAELGDIKLSTLLDPAAIHYALRRFGIEQQPQDAISFHEKIGDIEKVRSFQLKIFTLVEEKGAYKIDHIETVLTGTYDQAIPFSESWRF